MIDPRRRRRFGVFQVEISEQTLGMDGISLVLNPPFLVSNDTAEDASLLDVWGRWPKPNRFADVVRFEQLIAPY